MIAKLRVKLENLPPVTTRVMLFQITQYRTSKYIIRDIYVSSKKWDIRDVYKQVLRVTLDGAKCTYNRPIGVAVDVTRHVVNR